jgi:selenocysteine lyase/cysteine desulfurase
MPIYLDNAATTFPKPDAVYCAVDYALREIGVGPGRGGHQKGMEQPVLSSRREALAAFWCQDSSRLIFTLAPQKVSTLPLPVYCNPVTM